MKTWRVHILCDICKDLPEIRKQMKRESLGFYTFSEDEISTGFKQELSVTKSILITEEAKSN